MFILIQFLDLMENLAFDGALQWLPKWIQITWYVHVSPCFNFASHYKNTFIYYLLMSFFAPYYLCLRWRFV